MMREPNPDERCQDCDGYGVVSEAEPQPTDHIHHNVWPCVPCKGTGRFDEMSREKRRLITERAELAHQITVTELLNDARRLELLALDKKIKEAK